MTTYRSSRPDRMFRFGAFELSEREGELRKNGVRIKLQDHPFRVLLELLSNAGRLVTREELQQKLWPDDTFVDFDVGVNTAIRKLRQALGDEADNPRFIETLARRGYRFIAPVTDVAAALAKDLPPVIGETTPAIQASAAEAPVASPSDITVTPSLATVGDSKSATDRQNRRNKPRWYWVLAASCALALVIYGSFVAWRTTNSPPRLAIEQPITANPPEAPITGAVISPDGKYLAFSDPTGVYVRHLASGETRPLQLPPNFDAIPTSWFPDSTHLLLTEQERGKEVPDLWKISILGGGPQNLVENASGGVISPDGTKLAFVRVTTGKLDMWLANSDGSAQRRIVEAVGPRNLSGIGSWATRAIYVGSFVPRLAWSPRAYRIAFVRSFYPAYPDPAADNKFALETVAVGGGPPKVLLDSPQLRPALVWAPDGRLLFAKREAPPSNRSDVGIWSIRVDEVSGEPAGGPVLVSRGVGRVGEMSVSAGGHTLVFSRANTQPQIFITELDAEGRSFKTPHRLTLDENMNVGSTWTPDGYSVVFVSNRSGTWKLFRQGIDQTTPEVLAEFGSNFVLARLNPEGTHILYSTDADPNDPSHKRKLVQIPVTGGQAQEVLSMADLYNYQCARSPSKLCVLSTFDGSTVRFFRFDLEARQPQEFASFTPPDSMNWSLSPDGSMLAIVETNAEPKITFMNVNDKSTREVQLSEYRYLNNVDWTAAGKSVYSVVTNASDTNTVLEIEPSGGHRALLEGGNNTSYFWAIQSPDGKHVLLEQVVGENNVWMVENF